MATQIEPAPQTAEDAFRAEVQQFLADNFPAELKGQSNALAGVDGPTNEPPAQTKWREAVGARGWGTPTWPKEYGGGGLTPAGGGVEDPEGRLPSLAAGSDARPVLAVPGGHGGQPRLRYSPVRVSTLTVSPGSMKSGTWTTRPVSRVAGLVAPELVSPLRPGSDLETRASM